METAQGSYSSLNPMELATMPGLPGLSTIGDLGMNPSLGADHAALHELTSYADDLNQSQALTEAVKASRTDMTAAVPAQLYIEDTRNSKWTITNTNQGFSSQGSTTAYLSSAQCVDLKTTRLTGSVQITLPAVTGTPGLPDYWILGNCLPLMAFTYGLQIGQNGNVLQDPGTSTDQAWLTQMRLAKKPFTKSDLYYSTSGYFLDGAAVTTKSANSKAFSFSSEENDYISENTVFDGTIPAATTEQVLTSTFTIRPTHSFFNIVKTWPPNIPLKMIIEWRPTQTSSLVSSQGLPFAQNLQAQVQLRIHTIRSEEIYLEPSMRTYIMNHFETGPVTNMNQLALARTMNRAALFDPTFGIPQFNAANIGGIFQFEVHRLSSHTVSGNQFQFHPVLNGSARPTRIVVAFPHNILPYSSSIASLHPPRLTAPGTLTSIQILYNGQTVWDEPYINISDVSNNMEPLYAESARYAGADATPDGPLKPWFSYSAWAQDRAWIVVNLAPSHNDSEVQPNSSAPVEIRGQFSAPLTQSTNIRVGLFFDQTMLLQKNNTAVFSLPIY